MNTFRNRNFGYFSNLLEEFDEEFNNTEINYYEDAYELLSSSFFFNSRTKELSKIEAGETRITPINGGYEYSRRLRPDDIFPYLNKIATDTGTGSRELAGSGIDVLRSEIFNAFDKLDKTLTFNIVKSNNGRQAESNYQEVIESKVNEISQIIKQSRPPKPENEWWKERDNPSPQPTQSRRRKFGFF